MPSTKPEYAVISKSQIFGAITPNPNVPNIYFKAWTYLVPEAFYISTVFDQPKSIKALSSYGSSAKKTHTKS